jgi:hypothetical protein
LVKVLAIVSRICKSFTCGCCNFKPPVWLNYPELSEVVFDRFAHQDGDHGIISVNYPEREV